MITLREEAALIAWLCSLVSAPQKLELIVRCASRALLRVDLENRLLGGRSDPLGLGGDLLKCSEKWQGSAPLA